MPSTACVLKSSSGSLPDYCFEMHHKDPAAPGHQSASDGLLPAFKANTKPLKYRALDQLLRIGILVRCAPWTAARSSISARFPRSMAILAVSLWSTQGWRHQLIQLKYPGPERAAARCLRAGLKDVAN